jgi:hypothetical protein
MKARKIFCGKTSKIGMLKKAKLSDISELVEAFRNGSIYPQG